MQIILTEKDKEKFWSKVEKKGPDECWLWKDKPGVNGYGAFYSKNHERMTAHRASFLINFGYLPSNLCVCHKCDVKMCTNPSHLFLGTLLDNIRDKVNKGRQAKGKTHGWALHPEKVLRGEACSYSKLTEKDVQEIKFCYWNGLSQIFIAKAFQISNSLVSLLVNGKRWRHLA